MLKNGCVLFVKNALISPADHILPGEFLFLPSGWCFLAHPGKNTLFHSFGRKALNTANSSDW